MIVYGLSWCLVAVADWVSLAKEGCGGGPEPAGFGAESTPRHGAQASDSPLPKADKLRKGENRKGAFRNGTYLVQQYRGFRGSHRSACRRRASLEGLPVIALFEKRQPQKLQQPVVCGAGIGRDANFDLFLRYPQAQGAMEGVPPPEDHGVIRVGFRPYLRMVDSVHPGGNENLVE